MGPAVRGVTFCHTSTPPSLQVVKVVLRFAPSNEVGYLSRVSRNRRVDGKVGTLVCAQPRHNSLVVAKWKNVYVRGPSSILGSGSKKIV